MCVCVNTFGGIPPVSTICALNHKEGLYLSASGYHGANPDAIAKGMEKVDYVFAIGTQNLLSKEAANGINVAVYPNQ